MDILFVANPRDVTYQIKSESWNFLRIENAQKFIKIWFFSICGRIYYCAITKLLVTRPKERGKSAVHYFTQLRYRASKKIPKKIAHSLPLFQILNTQWYQKRIQIVYFKSNSIKSHLSAYPAIIELFYFNYSKFNRHVFKGSFRFCWKRWY